MKTGTCHHGRGLARHNNRDFDLANAPHIDPERGELNAYWVAGQGWAKPGEKPDFDKLELAKYGELFGDALKIQNNGSSKTSGGCLWHPPLINRNKKRALAGGGMIKCICRYHSSSGSLYLKMTVNSIRRMSLVIV